MLGEVAFPQARRQEMDVKSGMGVDALEYIDEVDVRIHSLEATRGEEALHDVHILCFAFVPAEEPSLSAHCNGPNLPLEMICVEWDGRRFEKHAQGSFPLQRILGGFREGIGRQ